MKRVSAAQWRQTHWVPQQLNMQLEISVLKGRGSQKRAFHALNMSSKNSQDLCCGIELEVKTNQA